MVDMTYSFQLLVFLLELVDLLTTLLLIGKLLILFDCFVGKLLNVLNLVLQLIDLKL